MSLTGAAIGIPIDVTSPTNCLPPMWRSHRGSCVSATATRRHSP